MSMISKDLFKYILFLSFGLYISVLSSVLTLGSVQAQSFRSNAVIDAKPELQTVSFVDVSKYLGRWYQIARNPLPFEPLNCACAQQTLNLNDQNEVEVYNSCNVGDPEGPLQGIRGKAFSQDSKSNSKFTVDFNLPVLGQYWIIALADDYSWAVVSDPDRRSLYILSKTPDLNLQSYTQALAEASQQVSLEKLKVTEQMGCIYP